MLDRKDNLYLVVRGEDGGSRVVKYSDSGIRIENKKSEAMLSNLIRGSNPSYPPRSRDARLREGGRPWIAGSSASSSGAATSS